MIIEKPLYPQLVTVWYGFQAGGIIGPYVFENEAKAAVSKEILFMVYLLI